MNLEPGIFISITQVTLLILSGAAVLYIFIFSLAGIFYRQKEYLKPASFRRIAVLIPGYKEDDVILETAKEALKQDYPADFFDIVIIADSYQTETLSALRVMPLKVVDVSFTLSTKAKALNKAMELIDSDYDIAVILDADNIMESDFLKKINAAFERGFYAVQGHRLAKNQNTSFAVLDAVSEEINNHIFRKGHRALGFSSAIIGSGMAFRYDFFREIMTDVNAVGGFDKELELKMLKNGHKIEYLDDALVYDEKVQKPEVFANQRRRWLAAQFHYFRKDIVPSLRMLLTRGNFDYFDKAVQFIQPPRILLLSGVLLLSIIFISYNQLNNLPEYFTVSWLILVVVCITAFILAVPRSFYDLRTFRALGSLPQGIMLMVLSLLKIKGANRKFIHTKHGSN